ncbi:MAG: diaminopimelate aminotransferase [Thermoprotei archaeon]|nr:MAG: diaminopimelate aminotransferase [Thermoprotei archaeon]
MSPKSYEELWSHIDCLRGNVVKYMVEALSINSVNPSYGGPGELRKAEYIYSLLEGIGFDELKRIDVPDERAEGGVRPNIIAKIKGKDSGRSLWIISHLDVVPPGDLSLWKTDPFKPVVTDGKIYARGAEDNGQGIFSSITAALALRELELTPSINFALAIVSDEEAGSTYGVKHLLDKGVFKEGDLIVVPDAGSSDGLFVEIAEKSILWLKITTYGKQVHASTPHLGLNAHRLGMRIALTLDEVLHSKYSGINPLFDPPISTFEPTMKEANVENVNTIPGVDVVYFDCRVLPEVNLDEVIETVRKLCTSIGEAYGGRVEVEIKARSDAPPPTSPDSEVVKRLVEAIKMVKGKEPRVGGIGGGTVAAAFRRKGMDAVVWATIDETAHQPNEYCKIENLLSDAKVFATMSLL